MVAWCIRGKADDAHARLRGAERALMAAPVETLAPRCQRRTRDSRLWASVRCHRWRHSWFAQRDGVARSYVHIAGRWQDNVLYQLLTPAPQTVVTY